MRHLLPFASLAFLFAFFVAMPALAEAPTPMLWKVSKGGSTVYLLGSMHLLKDADYPLSPDVDAAYKDAEKLVFEISPADLNSPATAAAILLHGTYRDPKHKLQDDLSPSTWKQLVSYGAKNNLPVAMLQKLEPWTMSLTLLALEVQKIGMKPELGLDMHFMQMAKTDHKSTAGLETVDQQLAFFYDAPIKVQVDMLRQSIDEIADFQKAMDKEHDTWRRGDADAIQAETKKEFAKYPDLYQNLLAQRNRNWIPQIEKMLADGNNDTLLIVGAAHLPGSDGVVKLLQQKGYTVERICTGCAQAKRKL